MPVRAAWVVRAVAAAALALTGLTGCSGPSAHSSTERGSEAAGPLTPQLTATPLAPLQQRSRADVLVLSPRSLPDSLVARLSKLQHTAAATRVASGSVTVGGETVHVIAVDPARFRAFAPAGTAETTAVWDAVSRGELVVAHATAKALRLELGSTVLVLAAGGVVPLRLGALATTLPGADFLVDRRLISTLHLRRDTGVVLSARAADSAVLASEARKVAGKTARIDLLTPPKANPVAFLTGSRAARAFGAFSYRYFSDGTIEPDARWVAENIRTERVPILGVVTCHRLMLAQLVAALRDVQRAGLSSALHPDEYGGCYVPRFIERSPEHPISLHTWGIAIDLNVPGNLRGTRGRMDRRVVAIFKRWGFRWGGDWSWTDPMHFELGALLKT
ncbi:MAG: hypothetical protein QOK42_99 [Frankiaceae bacterium]|nr:hypothetical protein [Frankiaceae bacterium]MDX6275169.1 hypothetical protein [Frankiales bacterium]